MKLVWNKHIAKKANKIAKKIARNNSHGYDNRVGYRLGTPDYACSTYVAVCYIGAGVAVPANSYTQTMKKDWHPYGFRDVFDKDESIDIATGTGLRVGDILIAPGKHTAIVVKTLLGLKLAEACGNPRGGAANGKPGDQTGREIRIRKYYNDGWTQVLRYYGGAV